MFEFLTMPFEKYLVKRKESSSDDEICYTAPSKATIRKIFQSKINSNQINRFIEVYKFIKFLSSSDFPIKTLNTLTKSAQDDSDAMLGFMTKVNSMADELPTLAWMDVQWFSSVYILYILFLLNKKRYSKACHFNTLYLKYTQPDIHDCHHFHFCKALMAKMIRPSEFSEGIIISQVDGAEDHRVVETHLTSSLTSLARTSKVKLFRKPRASHLSHGEINKRCAKWLREFKKCKSGDMKFSHLTPSIRRDMIHSFVRLKDKSYASSTDKLYLKAWIQHETEHLESPDILKQPTRASQ